MEIEMPPLDRVDRIHEGLVNICGQRIHVKANLGRSRIVERTGILKYVHPSLFIVETEERRGRKATMSYQYVDVLTGMVELFDAKNNNPLFDFLIPSREEEAYAMAEEEDELVEEDAAMLA